MSYNYLILNRRARCVKIGYTTKPPNIRLAMLQVGSPDKLELIRSWPGTCESESDLHRALSPHRENGEWFRISPELIHVLEPHLSRRSLELLKGIYAADPLLISPARRKGRPRTGSVRYSKRRKHWVAQLDWIDSDGKRRQLKRKAESDKAGAALVKTWIQALAEKDSISQSYTEPKTEHWLSDREAGLVND